METMEIEVDELGPRINGDMPIYREYVFAGVFFFKETLPPEMDPSLTRDLQLAPDHLRSGGQQYAGFLECVIACVAEPRRPKNTLNSQGFGGGLESWKVLQ